MPWYSASRGLGQLVYALTALAVVVVPKDALVPAVLLLWAVVTGVLASVGRKKLQEANPQLPQTQQSLKEDAAWVRAQKS